MHYDQMAVRQHHALESSHLQELRDLGPHGESLADKAVAEFLNTGPQHLFDIRRAAAERATDELLHEANLLKNLALLIGAMGVAAECTQIHRAGCNTNYGVVHTAIAELARELALAEDALRQEDEDRS